MTTNKLCSTSGPATRGRRLHFLARLTMLALLALFATTPALAGNGRDFAGFYHYEKTADVGDTKQMTLSLRLFNYSGANVADAVVMLEGQLPLGETYGSIAGVYVDDGASGPVTGTFAIPDADYQRWQAGALPHLRIEYTDSNGNRVRRPIELIPALMGERP